jgi:D-lactate dehydrogenase
MNIFGFIQEARKICGSQNVYTDHLRILSYGSDASFYRYLPKAVVKPSNEEEIISLIKSAARHKTPVTFRAAGTSLSGQTITNSIIILCSGEKFKKLEISSDGGLIKSDPGVIAGQANIRLKKYGRKLGPDPASVNSATIGGIVANNASGMTAGVWQNSYCTIKDLRLVFADGSLLDTSNPESVSQFMTSHQQLFQGISALREKIWAQTDWVEKIRAKYQIKNTSGYGLNSFIDFEDPVELLKHLIVGSEGTLAYISGISMETVPLNKYKAVGLLFFPDLSLACRAAVMLNEQKADAIELIDRKALQAIEDKAGIPEFIRDLEAGTTALLVEFSSNQQEELQIMSDKFKSLLADYHPSRPVDFTSDEKEIEAVWKVRKGIFPAVGANRKPGTTVVIEDVAFRLEYLPEAISDLRELLDRHQYSDAVIYGHANDGNVHFIFSEDFNQEENIARYRTFILELVDLIVGKYNGSLKAEHGTGRNMAPFVENEWGTGLWEIMKEIKQLFDPQGILNPGVIINPDPEVYLKNFKPIPTVHPLIDKCIECGFCEINCLSNEFSLSSRQRIISYRELQTLPKNKAGKFRKQFIVHAEDTCAADGLCSISCPVDIDTGLLIKSFRNYLHEKPSNPVASMLSKNMKGVVNTLNFGLGSLYFFANIFREGGMKVLFTFMHWISFKKIPLWHKYFPVAARFKNKIKNNPENSELQVVYFPSCISRAMGPAWANKNDKAQYDVTLELLQRAAYKVIYPEKILNLCCGTPWESKGYFKIADAKALELENALLKASNNGQIPILFDTSPCLYRMRKFSKKGLKIYDPVEFALKFLVDKLSITKTNEKIALHPTCTTIKMGLAGPLRELGEMCAHQVIIPENVGCCGFAGDKGFNKPELNAWALRHLKPAVKDCKTGYSNSRTCEIGLSKNSGIEYKSIIYLLEEVSRPA